MLDYINFSCFLKGIDHPIYKMLDKVLVHVLTFSFQYMCHYKFIYIYVYLFQK